MGLIIENIDSLDSNWKEKSYILLIRPEHIPPHLALMVQGKYFSMSVKGHSLGEDGLVWKEKLNRKKISVLWVEVEPLSIDLVNEYFKKSIADTALGQVTCLYPIRTIFNIEASFIFELIPKLSAAGKLLSFSMTPKVKSPIEIPEYTTEEILQYIKSLKQKQNV